MHLSVFICKGLKKLPIKISADTGEQCNFSGSSALITDRFTALWVKRMLIVMSWLAYICILLVKSVEALLMNVMPSQKNLLL